MSTLFKRSAVTLFFQLAAQAASIIVGIVIARQLGPGGKGATAYAALGLSLVTNFFNGQNDAIAYQFGNRRLSLSAVHRAMLHIFFWLTPLCMVVLIGLAVFMPSQRALLAAAAALPFALYAQFSTQFFLVIGRPLIANLQSFASTALYAIVLIPLLYWGHAGIETALVVWVLAMAAASIYAGINLLPYITGARGYSRDVGELVEEAPEQAIEHKLVLREQFVFMNKVGFSELASYLNLRIDGFVVSFMLGSAEFGIYQTAIATGELMWKVGQAVLWSAIGRIASETPERSAQLVAKVTRNIFALQMAMAVVLFIFAPPLVISFYGPAFAETATALRFLLPGLVFYTAEGAIGYFFAVQKNKPVFRLVIQSASVILCAGITFALIPRYSIIGAAAATSVTYLCVSVVMTILFTRMTKISAWELYVLQPSDIARYVQLFKNIMRGNGIKLKSSGGQP